MNKPHIEYNNLTGHWICHSEDDPWDICIGAGETPLMAYRSWESKCYGTNKPRMIIEDLDTISHPVKMVVSGG